MKYTIFIILFLINTEIISQDFSSKNEMSKTIITNSELKESGVINVSDILNLLYNWNISTINGYSFDASPNNLSLNQSVIISIDGQEIDLGNQDFLNLNLIPLTIDQIDTVEVISFPQLFNGKFTKGGLINFKTKKPTKGLSLNLFNSVGNEVGDPGPYFFTQETSPNVDKLGYLLSFNLNTRGENWYLRSFVKTEENYLTDSAIKDRINKMGSESKSEMLAASVILNFSALDGIHHFLFGYTQDDDFIFFKQIGQEVPAKKNLKHFGLNGKFELTQNIGLNYHIKYADNEFINTSSSPPFNFLISDKLIFTQIESEYKNKNITSTFGLSIENKNITQLGFSNRLDKITLYSSLNYFFTPNTNYVIDFSTTKQNDKILLNGALKNFWAITPDNNLTLAFSFSQNLFMDKFAIDSQLYSSFDYYANNNTDNKTNLLASSLSFNSTLSRKLNIQLLGEYRNFFNYTLEDFNYQFNPINENIETNYSIKGNEFLKILSSSVEIEHLISKTVTHKLYYSYQKDFDGSYLFQELWKSFPNHKFVYSINLNFNDSFGIWAKYYFQSQTDWHQYRYFNYQSNDESSSTVKAYSTMDLSIQKWLWQKHIWLNLVVKDILNNRQYFHPIGAGFDLRFYFQIHVYFHSILI
ncbi:MAG: hypothetical protein KKF62_07080 [Bacteroidetes bacterium]|nr:hypothetical protein [Bacteroidota bacterium]MBU1114532.1 hypothetical protein [Bacteroidota bacterium]MBU1799925.1 hypothetical protein [Bacteroidota bacterium]